MGEIKSYKIEFTEKIAIEKMTDICDYLIARFNSVKRYNKKKDSSVYNSIADFLYVQKNYKKLIEKSQSNIELLIKDFINELSDSDQCEAYCFFEDEESQTETYLKVRTRAHVKAMVITNSHFDL